MTSENIFVVPRDDDLWLAAGDTVVPHGVLGDIQALATRRDGDWIHVGDSQTTISYMNAEHAARHAAHALAALMEYAKPHDPRREKVRELVDALDGSGGASEDDITAIIAAATS